MVKKLHCDVDKLDWVMVEGNGEHVEIIVHNDESDVNAQIYLTPENAKKLRKQIKAALAEIEGDPEEDIAEEKEEPAYIPHVGEVVEVYRNTLSHGFRVGQKVRVTETGNGLSGCHARALDTEDHDWAVTCDIRPIQNWKPKEGEKVLIVDSTWAPTTRTKSYIGSFGTFRGYNIGMNMYVVDCDKAACYNLSDLRPAE